MFRIGQIITSTQLVRGFKEVAKFVMDFSQPVLVSQKNGEFLVLIKAETFQDLVDRKLRLDGVEPPQVSLRDVIST